MKKVYCSECRWYYKSKCTQPVNLYEIDTYEKSEVAYKHTARVLNADNACSMYETGTWLERLVDRLFGKL